MTSRELNERCRRLARVLMRDAIETAPRMAEALVEAPAHIRDMYQRTGRNIFLCDRLLRRAFRAIPTNSIEYRRRDEVIAAL